MKVVTVYEAGDGRQFPDEAKCRRYEQDCKNAQVANDLLENGASLLAVLNAANQTRPWWNSDLTRDDMVALVNSTKDTGFIVHRWESGGEPTYRVLRIDHRGNVFLGRREPGDVYMHGTWIGVETLLRFAHRTAV